MGAALLDLKISEDEDLKILDSVEGMLVKGICTPLDLKISEDELREQILACQQEQIAGQIHWSIWRNTFFN